MSDRLSDSSSVEIGRYATILRRRWLVVVATTVLGVLAGAAYLVTQSPQATATALVQINVISAEPFANQRQPSGLLDPQTEVQTARSATVVSRAASEVGDVTPAEVRQGLQAEMISDATVMRLSYSGDSRDLAVAVTDAVAEQYIVYRSELAQARLDGMTERLQERRNVLRDQLREVNQRIANAPQNSSRAVQAESDRQYVNLELNSLLTEVNAVSSIDTTGGTVLTAARDNQVYLKPSRLLVLVSGLLAGLLLGLVLAFVRNKLDRRIFDAHDVAESAGGTVLGTVPSVGRGGSPLDRGPFETVRGLREHLLATLPAGHSSLAIVDLGRRAASLSPVALAVSMAEGGRNVQVVLAGYTRDELDSLASGFALQRRDDEMDGAVTYGADRFTSLAVTALDDRSDGVSAASVLARLLPTMTERSDLTVVSVGPEASESTRLAAMRLGRAVVALVRRRRTRSEALRHLSSEARAVGATLEGTIIAAPRG